MSATFSIVCEECIVDDKLQSMWIGQGSNADGMRALYSGDQKVMDRLKRFLNRHRGHGLVFVCDDTEGCMLKGIGYEEFEPDPDD